MNQGKKTEKPSERRQRLLDLLKTEGTLPRVELIERLQTSSATLSEDIKALNKQGIPIKKTSNRSGSIYLENPEKNQTSYSCITAADMRRWDILYLLQNAKKTLSQLELAKQLICLYAGDPDEMAEKMSMVRTHQELKQIIHKLGNPISMFTLFSDLQQLEKDGYIRKQNGMYYMKTENVSDPREMIAVPQNMYQIHSAAPHVLLLDDEQIEEYNYFYIAEGVSLPSASSLSNLHNKTTVLSETPEEWEEMKKNQNYIRGKLYQMNSVTREKLNQFFLFDYSKYTLTIPYRDGFGTDMKHKNFSVGMLVYSEELNQFYILGYNAEHQKIVLKLERIYTEGIIEEKHKNIHYNSPEFQDICNEMFQLDVEDPIDVEVRFRNVPSVYRRIEMLREFRCNHDRNSWLRIRISKDGKEIIYNDRIRGMESLARYLRSFGTDALVIEPKELADRMLMTSFRTMDVYERIHNYEKNDQSI